MLEVARPPSSPPSDSADHDILTIPDVWNPWKVKVKVIVLPFETRGWLETVLSVARQMSAKEGDSSGFRKWKYMEIRGFTGFCLEVIHIYNII
jgi:hypothetical protein